MKIAQTSLKPWEMLLKMESTGCNGCRQREAEKNSTLDQRITEMFKKMDGVNYDDLPDIFDPNCDSMSQMLKREQMSWCDQCKAILREQQNSK